jgi:type VI secretion system protein ImpH
MSYLDDLVAEPWRFDLLAALRRFERENPGKPRIGDAATLSDEYVVVSQNPYLEFPASNLESAVVEAGGRVRLVARFLGMFGPQGALPLSTTHESYLWLQELDEAFPRFADIFQRRFIALFYRAWADPRPIAQNDRPDADRFLAYIGSMIGVSAPSVHEADSIPTFAKLEYAGLIAPRVKSASRLRSLIAGLFGVKVEIEQFVGTWLTFDKSECSRLGAKQSNLGLDLILGASMFSVSDKFRIRVFVKDFEHYLRFLPGADLAATLGDAVFFYIGEELDWDLELAIPTGEITPVSLGKGAKLGWTSWMSPDWSDPGELRADARFHVVDRMADARASAPAN